MQFQIKTLAPEAEEAHGATVRGTGTDLPFQKRDIVRRRKISDKDGGLYKFVTGLAEEDIQYCRYLNDQEKEQYLKELPEIKNKLERFFGKEALENTNKLFWKEYGTIVINNDTLRMYFNDDNPETLLIKTMIRGGAFDIISPTIEGAQHHPDVQYYITDIESEAERKYEKRGGKPEAYMAYGTLKKANSRDALVYISWILHERTRGFTKKNAPTMVYQAIEDYIEGNYVKTGKKECAKKFCELAERWKTDKENLILEACIHAADHYGFIYTKDGFYYTIDDDLQIGKSIKDAIKILFEPKNRAILLSLKEKVDEKLDK